MVAFLELLRQPYTGCNPRGLLLARDKPLCKQLLSFHRIPSPQFAVFRRGIKLRLPRKIKYPLFVKSTTEDASLGISQASIVTDKAQLKQRIEFVHDQVQTDALVEEYIEGRELYVGVMGNDRLTRLPVWEMKFGSLSETSARHRDAPRQVGQEVPEETRHQHVRGQGICRRPWSRGSTSCRAASIAAWGFPAARASTTA